MAYTATIELPSEDTAAGFMDVGIHENVEMTKVEYGVSPNNNNEFLAFYFINSAGERGSHTEWVPKSKDGKDSEDQTKKEMNQMSRVKQIVKTFVPAEKFVFSADNFKEFAEKTISILGDSYKGVKIRVKFVYSGKYTSLPKPWKPRFIERMDNNDYYGKPMGKSSIKILSIDPMTRQGDPIPQTTNPFAATMDAPGLRNDLPF
jgi:hypothetical protein